VTTEARRRIDAPRAQVYAALVDPALVARWRFPAGMRCTVHEFDPREGGRVRVSLTYEGDGVGKSSGRTDTYRGRFVEVVPGERIVEVDEFESDDPAFQGEMTMTITLADLDGGTELAATHDGVPPGIRPEDNERGWSEALDRLAALVA
jgi:uncharacterized protein YndB with AHSA1/START domain